MIQNDGAESPDASTEDQREPRITHLSWIMAELKSDLGNFADNYFQNLIALAPWGLDVKNAYSLNLSNRLSGRGYVGNYSGLHSNVHLWYHGSLNTELGASNGDEDGNNNQIYFNRGNKERKDVCPIEGW